MKEINSTSTKSAPGHPRPNNAWLDHRDFDHGVQFCATDLVIVTHAAMRFCHENSERRKIATEQRFRRPLHTFVFGYDVTTTTVDEFRQDFLEQFKLAWRNIAKGADPRYDRRKPMHSLLALRAPQVVLTSCQLVLNSSVTNHQQYVRRNRQWRRF